MILSKEVSPFLIRAEEPISAALRKLEETKLHMVVVVDDDGRLLGTFSDGDFRRWLVGQESPSLTSRCVEAANLRCVSVPDGTSLTQIRMLMAGGLTIIPVLDGRGRVMALARPRSRALEISGRRISGVDPVFVIAEIGINHNGEVDMARRLVDAAAEAGADCAKFQMRDMEALHRSVEGASTSEDLGAEYTLDLLAESSLSVDEILGMLDYVESLGLSPLCTPWDLQSAQILTDYGLPAFKVASADLTNHPLLRQLIETERPLIVSTGMSTEAEIIESVDLLRASASAYALMQCNSSYPAAFKDLNLRYMDRLADIGDCVVGYSGHERGHHAVLAAVARGARIVEKHITLDRSARGSDHVVSLEPPQFTQMVREIRDVEAALGSSASRTLTQGERLNRLSLSKSLVATRDLVEGDHVAFEDVAVQSPGRGLQPNRLKDLLGKVLQRPVQRGQFFFEGDLTSAIAKPRDYAVGRPWGIPVRFHDWEELARESNPDFLEFHLSYRDMDTSLDNALPHELQYSLVVHSPDLFRGDLILDLASTDSSIRSRSIDELQRVVDLTHQLLPKFAGNMSPLIVVSMGGSSKDEPVPASVRPRLYELIVDSMSRIDRRGIQVLAQTLPPLPWYMGGQRYCNLFVEPDETAEFSGQSGIRLCLDVAHTKLACNYLGRSFARAVEVLAPQSDHLHLVDASGSDAEGLQIGEGEIDWAVLVEQLVRLAPNASFIPEIWQGHVDGGLGFWIAMERLEHEFRGSSFM